MPKELIIKINIFIEEDVIETEIETVKREEVEGISIHEIKVVKDALNSHIDKIIEENSKTEDYD